MKNEITNMENAKKALEEIKTFIDQDTEYFYFDQSIGYLENEIDMTIYDANQMGGIKHKVMHLVFPCFEGEGNKSNWIDIQFSHIIGDNDDIDRKELINFVINKILSI